MTLSDGMAFGKFPPRCDDALLQPSPRCGDECDLASDILWVTNSDQLFTGIFTGDHYSTGYYSYIWAEVLDADGFEAFKEKGIFDSATADSFRRNILEKSGTDDPMALYREFRGREPDVESLLKKRGLTS
jgi:Zn-dependent oligopeptidase